MTEEKTLHVLIGTPKYDAHEKGAAIVARALREAGFEVTYTGQRQQPEEIVASAVEGNVDAIGLSVVSVSHEHQFKEVLRLLEEQSAKGIFVFGGGVITENDAARIKSAGVKEFFLPGTRTDEVVSFLRREAGLASEDDINEWL